MKHVLPAWLLHVMLIGVAISIRSFFGYIFFGSVDIPCFISMTHCTLHHDLLAFPMWNYVPVLTYFLWLSGFLVIKTSLPLAFCMKVIPIFFDALLASLIVCIAQKKQENNASKWAWYAGLAYALCPIPIIITSIHGQWDALFLFFLILSFYIRDFFQDSHQKFFWFGIIFGLSLLLKPVSFIFLPFFFTATQRRLSEIFTGLIHWHAASQEVKSYVRYQATALVGFIMICSFVAIILVWYGFNLFKLVDTIGRYGNRGVQVLGLPFFSLIKDSMFAAVLKHRIPFLGVIGVLSWFYYRRQLSVFQAITITFSLLFGLSGICPQYFMWLMPFLLVSNLYWLTMLYGALVSIFLVLFYANPLANPVVPYQNMLSFAALNQYHWMTPPVWLASQVWITVIQLLGNCVIPFLCLVIAIYVWYKRMCATDETCKLIVRYQPYKDFFLMSAAAIVSVVFLLRCLVDFDSIANAFVKKSQVGLTWYQIATVVGKPCAVFGQGLQFMFLFLLLLVLFECSVLSMKR